MIFKNIHPKNDLLLIENPNEILGDREEIIIDPCYEK
jgi:hypothetical protein